MTKSMARILVAAACIPALYVIFHLEEGRALKSRINSPRCVGPLGVMLAYVLNVGCGKPGGERAANPDAR